MSQGWGDNVFRYQEHMQDRQSGSATRGMMLSEAVFGKE